MRSFVKLGVAIGIVFGVLFAALAIRSVAAAGDEQAVLKADQSLIQAIGKADKTAAGALLDEKFAWTDAEGKTRTKADTLRDLAALAKDNEGDTDVNTHFYGELAIVFGFHHDARFSRIWVKRPAGWRALIDLDTNKPKQALATAPGPANSGVAGDCDNPCRTLPFTPKTPADKAVLTEWQKTKIDEWHPDAADWETHVADDFLIINDRSERNKADRVAFAKKQQAAGISAPGDPITSMTMSDFGNAVLMISHHVPYRGGKPYYNVRVFVNQNGHWPIAWSQQTTIQAASPVPPVAAHK